MIYRCTLAATTIAALAAAPLHAAALAIVKSSTIVSDQVNLLNPRRLPGATLDYSLLVTNPLANLLQPVRRVVLSDTIAPTMKMRVSAIVGTGGGPVEFTDGDLLNLGLTGSGLSYRFVTLADASDSLEFSDGTSWAYVPAPDADGYDANVRAIRVTMSGTHATGASFRLRYRVAVK